MRGNPLLVRPKLVGRITEEITLKLTKPGFWTLLKSCEDPLMLKRNAPWGWLPYRKWTKRTPWLKRNGVRLPVPSFLKGYSWVFGGVDFGGVDGSWAKWNNLTGKLTEAGISTMFNRKYTHVLAVPKLRAFWREFPDPKPPGKGLPTSGFFGRYSFRIWLILLMLHVQFFWEKTLRFKTLIKHKLVKRRVVSHSWFRQGFMHSRWFSPDLFHQQYDIFREIAGKCFLGGEG